MQLIADVFGRKSVSQELEVALGKSMVALSRGIKPITEATDPPTIIAVRAAIIPCLSLMMDRRPRTLHDFMARLGLSENVAEQTLMVLSELKFVSVRHNKPDPKIYTIYGKRVIYRPPFSHKVAMPIQYLLVLLDGEKTIFEIGEIFNKKTYSIRSAMQHLEKAGLVERTGPRSNRRWALAQV